METTQAPVRSGTTNTKLNEFFLDQLQDIYWAEQKLVKTLPKMADAAHSGELSQAFRSHLEEIKTHVYQIDATRRRRDQRPVFKGTFGQITGNSKHCSSTN